MCAVGALRTSEMTDMLNCMLAASMADSGEYNHM